MPNRLKTPFEEATVAVLTRLFKSLADESRVKILRMLSRTGEMNVAAICTALNQSQPAVSHHLSMLRGAGLVDYRREGKFNYYALSPAGAQKLTTQHFPDGAPESLAVGPLEVRLQSIA